MRTLLDTLYAFRLARNPIRLLEELAKVGKPVVTFKGVRMNFITCFSEIAIDQVLVADHKNYEKDVFLKHWKDIFGHGLLVTEGEEWKRGRKIVQPSFSRHEVTHALSIIQKRAKSHISSLAPESPFNVSKFASQLTLEIALEVFFGTSLTPEKYQEIAEPLDECMNYFETTSKPIGYLLSGLPLPFVGRYKKAVAHLQKSAEIILSQRDPSRDDLSSHLLRSGLSPLEVRDHALTFLLAGHETTALSIIYCLELLAHHPKYQTFARENDHNLNCVLMEALRLRPPAWVIGRQRVGPQTHLEGVPVQTGDQVLIPIYTLQRDPKVFGPDAERFRPERWTPEFKQKIPKSAYMPFSYGPRMCIGSQFAMLELSEIIKTFLCCFSIELEPEVEPGKLVELRSSITARPKSPVRLKLKSFSKQ